MRHALARKDPTTIAIFDCDKVLMQIPLPALRFRESKTLAIADKFNMSDLEGQWGIESSTSTAHISRRIAQMRILMMSAGIIKDVGHPSPLVGFIGAK